MFSFDFNNFSFTIALLIFISYIFVDGLNAYYTLEVVKKNAYTSATVGSAIYLLLALGIINYTQNFAYIIPLIMGSWIGTFLVVKYSQKTK